MKVRKNFFIRRRAFSLIELFIAMIIIALFTSFITANITSQNQTARQEAEKLEAYITDLIRKAERRHVNFTIKFDSNCAYSFLHGDQDDRKYIYHTNPNNIDDKYDKNTVLNPGFSVSVTSNLPENLVYESNSGKFNKNGTFTLERKTDGSKYYVVVYEGRVRASEIEP